jgi:peptidoglycan/LPS O-acetylase OafA/YrhL
LLIFFRHYGLSSHPTSLWVRIFTYLSLGGWIGVDLFFVLSGFLITGILLDMRDRPGYFTSFYARRALRIFPVYYTVFVVLFLLTPLLSLQWHKGHLAYLFYVGNIAVNMNPDLANLRPSVSFLHLWSLAVEEQFYLVWPVVVMFIPDRRRLAWFCGGLSLAGLILRISLLSWMPSNAAFEWCYNQLPTHMDGLLYGALAAISVRTLSVEDVTRWARRILPCACVVMVPVLYLGGGVDFHSVPMTVAGFPALAAIFACTVLLALGPGSFANGLGNLRALRFIGRYSYGMYLFHILFWPGSIILLRWLQGRLHSVVLGGVCYVLLMLSATITLAVASYELYEKQWLKLKSRFVYKKSQPTVGTSFVINS